MRTRLALILLLLLSFTSAVLVDAVGVRDNLNVISETDTFDADDLDPYVAPYRSRVARKRPQSVKLSGKMSIAPRSLPQHSPVHRQLNCTLGLQHQDLHTVLMVFRI